MKRRLAILITTLTLSLSAMPLLAQTLDEAARKAAKQYDAKVLSARTVTQGKKQVHEIKLLTKDGVVKTVRVTVKDKER